MQLQWKYYYTGTQITQESGQRDMLRLDDISVIGTSTGITEYGPKIQASLFPNPNTGIFYVQISQAIAGPILLQLMDTQGKVVLSQIIEGPIKANSQLRLESSSLREGIYYCTLKTAKNDMITIPVVVLR
ncbi:MAG: T9SS type A sorting domain-containing protein [Saprospiraceae bacterium]|nr:T9SS type A sorting domain-containing protein [Saprospiraceae bacterium]